MPYVLDRRPVSKDVAASFLERYRLAVLAYFPKHNFGYGQEELPRYDACYTYSHLHPRNLHSIVHNEDRDWESMCELVDDLKDLIETDDCTTYGRRSWFAEFLSWCSGFESGRGHGGHGEAWWQTFAIPDSAGWLPNVHAHTIGLSNLQAVVWGAVEDLSILIRRDHLTYELYVSAKLLLSRRGNWLTVAAFLGAHNVDHQACICE